MWTLESLYEHFTKEIAARDAMLSERSTAQKEMVSVALAAAEKAVVKAELATDRKFEGVNEFRAAMGDQQRTFMPRVEAELMINALKSEINELKTANLKVISRGDGSRGLWVIILAVVSLLGTVIAIAARFF